MEIFERLLALILFIILLPIYAFIAILIFLTEPFKPIIYRGIRVGKYGKPFIMYKFRTLAVNAEKIVGEGLLNEQLKLYTPIGRLLRFLKLDELPQLINVIKGEMSFIGPRPDRPIRFYNNIRRIPNYEKRLLVKPGMSGIAQIEGDYYSLPEEKLYWDLIWVNHGNLSLYFKYIFKTITHILNKAIIHTSLIKKIAPWISIVIIIAIRFN